MSARLSRTITICVIWMSVSMFLTFGLPNFQNLGGSSAEAFYFFSILVAVTGATISTIVIWRSGRKKTYTGHGFEVVRSAQPLEQR